MLSFLLASVLEATTLLRFEQTVCLTSGTSTKGTFSGLMQDSVTYQTGRLQEQAATSPPSLLTLMEETTCDREQFRQVPTSSVCPRAAQEHTTAPENASFLFCEALTLVSLSDISKWQRWKETKKAKAGQRVWTILLSSSFHLGGEIWDRRFCFLKEKDAVRD